MKLYLRNRRSREGGSALMISMLIVAVLGVSMGSYLALVSSQNHSVARSMAWASAIPAAEAGVEEALTHLARNDLVNIASDGWVERGAGWYQKCGNLGGGFGYVTRIQNVNPPLIMSTGIVPAPGGPATIGTTDGAILGAALDQRSFIRRSVRVDTIRDNSFFVDGVVAKGQIDLAGNNVKTDSFDSEDPNYSTDGKYDPAKAKDNGGVATNSGLVNSLSVGNADIMGTVATGPGGSVAIGPNGTVGDKDWVTAGNKGIQPGRASSDMNVSFPDVEAPFTTGSIPPSGTVDGVTYDYIIDEGKYVISSLSGKVLVRGDAQLYVSSSFNITGEGGIWIEENGSLELYSAVDKVNIAGKGVVNGSGLAKNFQYFGLPSNTELKIAGNGEFIGAIYAPNAHLHLAGGGKDTEDFKGASISASVKINGKFQFHYDEALARLDNGGRGYIPDSWNEIETARALPASAYAGVSLVVY
jgi:hypothetical protein